MSDNIKSLRSSKVRAIKSTHSSADKTGNVKMVKKWAFLNLHLIFYMGRKTAGVAPTDPGYHLRWSGGLSSNLSALGQRESCC